MSGIDEQFAMLTCKCRRFVYWILYEHNKVLGFLNTEEYSNRQNHPRLNLERGFGIAGDLSIVTRFECFPCGKIIGKNLSSEKFNNLIGYCEYLRLNGMVGLRK